ncbi:hypothetical protein [Novosphingobium sp.]|uniref:hypothetical protein n=1 Tax=Novosphingobium sp. TaxID=1874826 RepID=UPI003D6D99C2
MGGGLCRAQFVGGSAQRGRYPVQPLARGIERKRSRGAVVLNSLFTTRLGESSYGSGEQDRKDAGPANYNSISKIAASNHGSPEMGRSGIYIFPLERKAISINVSLVFGINRIAVNRDVKEVSASSPLPDRCRLFDIDLAPARSERSVYSVIFRITTQKARSIRDYSWFYIFPKHELNEQVAKNIKHAASPVAAHSSPDRLDHAIEELFRWYHVRA